MPQVGDSQSKDAKKPEGTGRVRAEMEKFLNKEKRELASVSVRINKAKLDKEIEMMGDESGKELLKMFQRLPEDLKFQPEKTLIIGDNAAGKSTLAKALLLACKKEKEADTLRDLAITLNDESMFSEADQDARGKVFEPIGDEYWREWLATSGLASNLGRVMEVVDFFSATSTIQYADFQEIIGKIKRRYDGMEIGANVSADFEGASTKEYRANYGRLVLEEKERHLKNINQMSKEMGSARQMVEKEASNLIHGDTNQPGPGVFFLDEPESGISPMRHRKIEENIDNMIGMDEHQGSIVIIPTNSNKLFESDLPRIDLRFPERGIFRPSEFPGYFEAE